MPTVTVTLVGGSPWGFRIQGGRGTGQPLRLSKVNPGSKANYQGLKEGDLLKMINGHPTNNFSQMDVQNIIKGTGHHLTLEVERHQRYIDMENLNKVKKRLIFNDTINYDTNPQNSVLTTNNSKLVTSGATNTNIMDNSFAPDNSQDNSNNTTDPTNQQKPTKCDFTNCLRPSELQKSSFLEKLSATSSNACPFSDVNNSRFPSPTNKIITADSKTNEIKPQKQAGQCDYASCLKPSQVQNSSFKAELSEITANKSLGSISDVTRNSSPLTIRSPTPPLIKYDNRNVQVEKESNEIKPTTDSPHRSEITIILQTSSNKGPEKKETNEPIVLEKHSDILTTDIAENSFLSDNQNDENQSTESMTNKASNSNDLNPPSNTSNSIPPPPPPPPSGSIAKNMPSWKNTNVTNTLNSQIQNQRSNLVKTAIQSFESKSVSKTPVVMELENHFKTRSHSLPNEQNLTPPTCYKAEIILEPVNLEVTTDKKFDNDKQTYGNHSPLHKTENYSFVKQNYIDPTLLNGKNIPQNGTIHSSNTIITTEPPPPGSVLVDRKVTLDGDKVHTDRYYALPVKEVTRETTSTTKFIPAPPKYEGIGPTEDGIPIGLRNSVKNENKHNWYKTMYKSLHKADSSNDPQEYIIGYSSEPESSKKDTVFRKKSATLDNRSSANNASKLSNNFKPSYPASAKSSIETYNVRPRLIEDYEPGQSSVTDDEITIGYKRFLPAMNVPKSSYEFKNGYEQDNKFTKKLDQPDPPTLDQQKTWYKEVQLGGEVPQYGLGKPAPEKPKDPVIGPLPPPPLHYNGPTSPNQATRPLTLPTDYFPNENGLCQQVNGAYEIQMRQAIHTELHQRLSPSSSSQLSSPTRSILKSPNKSPDLKIPARALFDFRAESPKEVPLKKGDDVLILRQLDKNWYEGEKQGVTGIFPINYVEIVPPEHSSYQQSSHGLGKVLYDFTAHAPIELTVKKHDTVTLLKRVDSNWYEAQIQSKKGIIPVAYLQVLQEPADRSTPLSSPSSFISSPGNRPSSREGILKTVTPIPYSNSTSNQPIITNERNKLQSRIKKSSNLVEPVMYRALYSYSPQNTDELELGEGDTIYVVEMCDDGWYVGTSVRTGVFGIFPGNYVEKV